MDKCNIFLPFGWILSFNSSSLGASTFSGRRGVPERKTLMFPLACCDLCQRTMSYCPAPTGFCEQERDMVLGLVCVNFVEQQINLN